MCEHVIQFLGLRKDGRLVNEFWDPSVETGGLEGWPAQAPGAPDESWSSFYEDTFQVAWFDLEKPTAEELAWLGRTFRFHPLAIEDCAHFDQRPKIEGYGGHLFLVVHGLVYATDALPRAYELHSFLSKGLVVTVHEERIDPIRQLLQKISRDRTALPVEEDALLHRILDGVVDALPAALLGFEESLEQIDEQLLGLKGERFYFDEILCLQRALNVCRHTLAPQKEVLRQLSNGSVAQIRESNRVYFRDVLDHLERDYLQFEELREGLWSSRELSLAVAAQRTNDTVRRLTLFSAVFLPLTFITGFFGMNFAQIPWGSHTLFVATLLMIIAIPIGLAIWFAWKRRNS